MDEIESCVGSFVRVVDRMASLDVVVAGIDAGRELLLRTIHARNSGYKIFAMGSFWLGIMMVRSRVACALLWVRHVHKSALHDYKSDVVSPGPILVFVVSLLAPNVP